MTTRCAWPVVRLRGGAWAARPSARCPCACRRRPRRASPCAPRPLALPAPVPAPPPHLHPSTPRILWPSSPRGRVPRLPARRGRRGCLLGLASAAPERGGAGAHPGQLRVQGGQPVRGRRLRGACGAHNVRHAGSGSRACAAAWLLLLVRQQGPGQQGQPALAGRGGVPTRVPSIRRSSLRSYVAWVAGLNAWPRNRCASCQSPAVQLSGASYVINKSLGTSWLWDRCAGAGCGGRRVGAARAGRAPWWWRRTCTVSSICRCCQCPRLCARAHVRAACLLAWLIRLCPPPPPTTTACASWAAPTAASATLTRTLACSPTPPTGTPTSSKRWTSTMVRAALRACPAGPGRCRRRQPARAYCCCCCCCRCVAPPPALTVAVLCHTSPCRHRRLFAQPGDEQSRAGLGDHWHHRRH